MEKKRRVASSQPGSPSTSKSSTATPVGAVNPQVLAQSEIIVHLSNWDDTLQAKVVCPRQTTAGELLKLALAEWRLSSPEVWALFSEGNHLLLKNSDVLGSLAEADRPVRIVLVPIISGGG